MLPQYSDHRLQTDISTYTHTYIRLSNQDHKPTPHLTKMYITILPLLLSPSRSTSRPTQPKLKTSISGLLNSSGRITPIPEISALQDEPSELSTGNEHEIPMLSRQNSIEVIKLANTAANQAAKKKKLSFIAELEGSEPIYLPSTVYTPISANADTPVTYELEAPQTHFILPPRPINTGQGSTSVSELSANDDEQPDNKTETALSAVKAKDRIDVKPGKIARKPVPTGAFSNLRSLPEATNDTATIENSQDEHKTPKLSSDNRMSAKIENMKDLIHQPLFTPAESPDRESSGDSLKSGNSTDSKPIFGLLRCPKNAFHF